MSRTRADTPSATILHISDTQFGQYHRFGEGVQSLGSQLIYDLRNLVGRDVPPIDLILISGDIAEQSALDEYEQARAFIDQICEFTNLKHDRVVIVPGNHDVNWNLSQSYFFDCKARKIEPREPYTRKWQFYQQFVTSLHGEAAFTEDQPYRLHKFDDLGIVVAALNSTWQESHDAHYGWCGDDQLRWFEDQLRGLTGMVRIGLLHHNVRRGATADNENLRDADALDRILGPHLDLLLHGHTHEGKEDRLPDGTLVLATGSAAVNPDWRPAEVGNQYQILHLTPGTLTRTGRAWDGHRWIADTRVGRSGNDWQFKIPFEPPGWKPDSRPEKADPRPDRPQDRTRHEDDFVSQVEYVTVRDVGREARVERRSKGRPPLEYLLVVRPAAPMRCVGVLDQAIDGDAVDRFDELVFGPLRERGPTEFVIVHRGPDIADLRKSARRRGIQLKTWAEYNDLLESSTYAAWLKVDLESDKLYPQPLYLPQRFRDIDRFGKQGRDVREDLLSEIYDTMLEEDGRFVLLLGDAGYGKSFLVRRLAYLMLGNDQCGVTPIVIYLRDRDKRQTVEDMVSNVLIPSRAAFNADRFQHSLEAGSLALLIDGYDEFAVRVGYTNAAAQLNTFIQALRGRAKVLLTTRPNHFRSADEATSKLFDSIRVHDGRVYQLEPFDRTQQLAFLTRWFELNEDARPEATANRWMDALARVDNLPELAKTPRMLSFMVEDLTVEEIEAAASEGIVTAADLYQRLVDKWLESEAIKIDPDDERRVLAGDRQRMLEDLALQLWRINERDVTEQSLQEAARQLDLTKHKLTLDQAAQVLGGRTLLRVDDNRWKFAHQSVWEFLLANRLAALLREGHALETLGEAELTSLTIRFLRDLAPNEAIAWVKRVAERQS